MAAKWLVRSLRRTVISSLGVVTALWWWWGGDYFGQLLGWAIGNTLGCALCLWLYKEKEPDDV